MAQIETVRKNVYALCCRQG